MNGLRIAGTGTYLPGPPIDRRAVREFLRRTRDCFSNAEQDRLLEQTGILTRHFAIDVAADARRETNTTMAARAGERALRAAGWMPEDVDLLIVTTIVPDQLMPPTSTLVQEALGIPSCTELEISANCTAPTKGLWIAASQLQLGTHRRALVCSSQLASFGFNPPWANPGRMTPSQAHLRWVLSDGAAAIALEVGEPDIALRVQLQSVGVGKRSGMSLKLGVANPDIVASFESGAHHVTQDPRYVLKEGIKLATAGLQRMLRTFEMPGDSIDHFIPSVSSLLVERVLRDRFARFGIRPEVWRTNFTRVGYVGSVAVPIMLDELAREGNLRPGEIVCTVAEESSKWMFAGSVFRWNP
jgi:3-oxoacyl-[acyl-carrier-protein] synthase-3